MAPRPRPHLAQLPVIYKQRRRGVVKAREWWNLPTPHRVPQKAATQTMKHSTHAVTHNSLTERSAPALVAARRRPRATGALVRVSVLGKGAWPFKGRAGGRGGGGVIQRQTSSSQLLTASNIHNPASCPHSALTGNGLGAGRADKAGGVVLARRRLHKLAGNRQVARHAPVAAHWRRGRGRRRRPGGSLTHQYNRLTLC